MLAAAGRASLEARRAAGTDAAGRPIGAEENDYGNLITPLRRWLRGAEYLLER